MIVGLLVVWLVVIAVGLLANPLLWLTGVGLTLYLLTGVVGALGDTRRSSLR